MPNPERRFLPLALVGAAGLALSTSPLWGISLGKRIGWLEVQRVEVSGTALLAPHDVLAASGIRPGQHLLDQRAPWEQALLAHPVIAEARVVRKPPHTLRIRVREKRPVALVEDGTLRFATAAGEILPLDPAVVVVDLPLVRGSFADSAGVDLFRRVLAEAGRLAVLDPAVMAEVSEIRPAAGEPDVLVLLHSMGEVLLPIGATAVRMEQLRNVLADVARRFPAPAGEPRRPRLRLDLRFEDQIVVSPSTSRELS
jgi:cell division protein FtsQ